jgi:hypothetical protein
MNNIIRHQTLESLLEFMWGCPISELEESTITGADEHGEEHEITFEKMVENIKYEGLYGCAGNDDIHIWFNKDDVDLVDLVHLLAHERAHIVLSPHAAANAHDDIAEELMCEAVAECAVFALEEALKLLNKEI